MEQTQPAGQGPDAAASYCEWHPDVETRLSCSHCARSICTRCMVQAPVGIRCQDCGKVAPIPTFDVRPIHYTRGMAVAGLCAFGEGILWWVYNVFLLYLYGGPPHPVLPALAAIAIGFVTGEVVSRSINKKRSILLSLAAGISVIVSYMVAVSIQPFFSLYTLLFLAIGVFIAMQRLR